MSKEFPDLENTHFQGTTESLDSLSIYSTSKTEDRASSKMKTVINETLDWIERFKKMNGKYPTGEEVASLLTMQLPIEREQLEQANISGYNKACEDHCVQPLEIQSLPAAEEYYTQTFEL